VVFSPQEFKDIVSHPNIIGLKNSSGIISLRKELIFLKQEMDFLLYEGCEWGIDEALALGCDGAIVGLGTLGGALFRKLLDAFIDNNPAQMRKYQIDLLRVFHMIYGENNFCSIIGQKYALYKLGLLSSFKTLHPKQQNLPRQNKQLIENCLFDFRDIWELNIEKNTEINGTNKYVKAS
jgi:dihydrodipicolinate synthase/N-acetylneuraminate lyase